MPLKPFTYPLPETRFLHAGRLVYKFKIRYGNFNSADDLDNTESTVKELEEAIRVILGNLDDLHPFSTERFTIFPYLSKWQRVSKMRFKHGDVHLVPYPYICTMYLELNSFQQNVSFGKEVHKGSYKIVKERSEMSKSTEIEGTVKRRRVEEEAEIPYPESDMDRITPKKFSVSIVQHPLSWPVTVGIYGDLWNVTVKKIQKPVRLKVKYSYHSKWAKSETKEIQS